MRQRNIKDLDEKLNALSEYMIDKVNDVQSSLEIEIGCGKGKFLTALADKNRDKEFVGIEGQGNIILRALEKAKEKELTNIRYIHSYVDDLTEFFPENSADVIYLNFSDPWPKERHKKRRLTYRDRVNTFIKVLKPGGHIEFRTDNRGLYEFTLEEVKHIDGVLEESTEDLNSLKPERITTEYEDRFAEQGKNIMYAVIQKKGL